MRRFTERAAAANKARRECEASVRVLSPSGGGRYHSRMAKGDPLPSLKFEKEAWAAGALWVAGVDEVGCGPLAG